MFGIKSRKDRDARMETANDGDKEAANNLYDKRAKADEAASAPTAKVRGPGAPAAKSAGNALKAPSTLSQYRIDFIPEGVIIKRVFPRKGTNKWMVRFHSRITEYYAPTLDEAITELFKNQPVVAERYRLNAKEGR